jgi:hypothetical protein
MLPHADCEGYCRRCVSEVVKYFWTWEFLTGVLQEQLFSARGSPGNKRVSRSPNGVSGTIVP